MSSIHKKMKNLVSSKDPVQRGTVVRTTDSSIFVSSKLGLKEFQVTSPSNYRSGDTVKFQGNSFLGKVPSENTAKIVTV